MSMARTSKAISDNLFLEAKQALKKLGKKGEAGRRLQAIISAKTHGIKAVAEIFDITRMTLMSWIRKFEEESIQGLGIKPGRGPKSKLSAEQQEQIREIILSNPNIAIKELRLKIIEKFGVTVGKSTVHRIMKKLNFSYITPRPRHYKADKEKQEKFKKKSATEN